MDEVISAENQQFPMPDRKQKYSKIAFLLAGFWTLGGVVSMLVCFATLCFVGLPFFMYPMLVVVSVTTNPALLVIGFFAPVWYPAVVFAIAYGCHRSGRYVASIAVVSVALVALLVPALYIQHQSNVQKAKADADFAPLAGPFSGALVPGPTTIPPGYVVTGHEYYASSYDVGYRGPANGSPYTNPGSTGATGYNTINFSETKPLSGQENQYDKAVSSYEKDGHQKILEFTFAGSPGIIFDGFFKPSSTSTASYELLWKDGSNLVTISVNDVPAKQFTPQALEAMLGTLVRQP